MIPLAPEGFRSGFIALVGRPNVGKSTLLNALIGQKIAITSPVAQTTRNRLQGILTLPQAQLIFVDTPGIHKPHHRLGEILVHNAQAAMGGVDAIVVVVDGSQNAGSGDQFVAQLCPKGIPVCLCLNKQDLLDPERESGIRDSYQALVPAAPCLRVSARDPQSLAPLLDQLVALLPPGPYYYPPDHITDQPERFIVAELIREQILVQTRQEIPHSVAIVLDQVEELPKITRVLASIYVERDSQKRILIGTGGSQLKQIGEAARQQMEKLIDGKIYLGLFVKVRPHWRQSAGMLRSLGYREEQG